VTAEIRYPPASALDGDVTPTARFFVRDHLSDVPVLSHDLWRLRVDGLVDTPLTLDYDELCALPSRTEAVTLECAGNGNLRRGMRTAVGTAIWRGVPLAAVLELAGLRPEADEIVLHAADRGADPDQPGGPGRYARALTRAKALDPATLLAHRMNGEALPVAHGHPVRAVVPGHYGMDSVKWLTSITAARGPFEGFYQAHRYREVKGPDGLHSGRPIRDQRVKSLITWPEEGQRLGPGAQEIRGVAWAGPRTVDEVLVSADGGVTWRSAELLPALGRYAWRRWTAPWTPTGPGAHELVARAVDEAGETQCLQPLPARTYEANWVHRLTVTIEG
jgi:DMSO/TMAO reductase YedYZ molybdopterin-dependent catalytic subunit